MEHAVVCTLENSQANYKILFSIIFKMPGLRLQNPLQETHQAAHRFRRPIVVNILQDASPFRINKIHSVSSKSNTLIGTQLVSLEQIGDSNLLGGKYKGQNSLF